MTSDAWQWTQFRVLESGIPMERFANAGLSFDGHLCFVSDIDEFFYFVWDLKIEAVIWSSTATDPDHLPLDKWLKDGHIEIGQGIAAGSYRLFGVFRDYPLKYNDVLNITLHIDSTSHEIVLTDIQHQRELQRLKYEAFSYDWVFATFSDDFSTIAVIEPYFITFFRQIS